jgi:predicted DNA-binding protein
MADNDTTIRISQENKNRLDKLGGKGDTYDDILGRILTIAERK